MSESPSDSGDGELSISEYTDYFELLGVDESASTDEIEKQARKLLGQYHPDRCDHPEADRIFKTINRAEDVLTDSEQRAIYESLEHEEYVERREEGGEMTLSEDINATNISVGTEETSETPSTTTNISTDHGSVDRNERNSWTGKIKETGSYSSITGFEFGLTSREAVKKMYKEVWLVRVVFIVCFSLVVGLGSVSNPDIMLSAWGNAGLSSPYGLDRMLLVIIGVWTVLIVLASGVSAHYFLLPIEDNYEEDTDSDDGDAVGPDNSPDNARSEWDTHSRYDSLQEDDNGSTDTDNHVNKSLRYGSRLLLLGILMTAFAAVADGVHAWVYLYDLVSTGVEADLWWAIGSEEAREVVILLNAGFALSMFAFVAGGVIFTVHGLSQEVWYNRYFSEANIYPFLWDTLVGMCAVGVGGGIVVGLSTVGGPLTDQLPTIVSTYLGAETGVTGLSVAILAFTSLYLLKLVSSIRF